MGVTYDEARAKKRDPEVKHARQCAKVANFGFPGGLGPTTLVEYARKGYGVVLTQLEAENLRRQWLEQWSEFRAYFKWVERRRSSDGADALHVVQWYSNRQRGLVPYTAACNSYFQGLGADGAKHALYMCSRAAYSETESPFYGARPVNFVHDQIIAEVEEDRAHEQAFEMSKIMMEACNRYLPDVPTKCTPALSKFWCKSVEDVYDEPGGRLVPWDLARQEKREVYYRNGKRVEW